jgi:hypothetical protein
MTVLQGFHKETRINYNTDGTEFNRFTRAVALDATATDEEQRRAIELLHEFADAHDLQVQVEGNAVVTQQWQEV